MDELLTAAALSAPLRDLPPETPSSTLPLSASDLFLSLDDPTHNPVEEAGPNHFERPALDLTPLEQFYVDVAHSFAQEEVARRTAPSSTAGAAGSGEEEEEEEARQEQEELLAVHQYLARTRGTLQHFASMLDKVLARKTLHVTFAHSDSEHGQGADDKPTDAAFLLSRRNQLAALIQSHSTALASAAHSLSQQSASLSHSLALSHCYSRDLAHLSLHWLLRVRPAVLSAHTPPVIVHVGWTSGQEASGRVQLDRDSAGRVEVAQQVGKRSKLEERQWARTKRRQERRRLQQHLTAEQKDNDEEMQWEMDESASPATAALLSKPPPPPTSASLLGWPRTASRLHQHQRHLLQQQLYNALMAEARGWQDTQLSAVSMLSHTIHCHSPAFAPLSIVFDDGPQHPFSLLLGSKHTNAADNDGHTLYLSLLSQLTRHFIRFASSNRATPGTIAADDPPPPPPALLRHLVTSVYHRHIAAALRTALHAAVPLAAGVELSDGVECGPLTANVMRFVLKRAGGLLLDGVVDGVSMYAVVRRGKRLGMGGVDNDGGSEVSALDVELVRCVTVREMVHLIHFALQSHT